MFDSKDWDLLLLRSIVPKLAWALQDALDINPLQQDLDPFNWVLAWHPVMPAHHMVNLLEFRFFPKWHQVRGHASACLQISAAFLQASYHERRLTVRGLEVAHLWACNIKGPVSAFQTRGSALSLCKMMRLLRDACPAGAAPLVVQHA